VITIEKVHSTDPMRCYSCGIIFQVGDEVMVKQFPIHFWWGKQRKKAKANTHYGLMIHVRCPSEIKN
jgi:hypothetical protein